MGSAPWNGPSIGVSLHTIFFMAASGATQGPPVSLQPGDESIIISMPCLSARPAA